MRKALTRSVLAILAVLFMASQASAAPINPIAVGWLQWLETSQGQGQFSIISQNGINWQTDGSFPVIDQLTVNNFVLTVVPGGAATLSPTDTDGVTPGVQSDGFSYDSGIYGLPFPLSATLTGNVNQTQAMVDTDGLGGAPASLWNILDGGAITDIDGNLVSLVIGVTPNDLTLLYINAVPAAAAIPEPATMLLFGSGAMGLLARRRKANKKA